MLIFKKESLAEKTKIATKYDIKIFKGKKTLNMKYQFEYKCKLLVSEKLLTTYFYFPNILGESNFIRASDFKRLKKVNLQYLQVERVFTYRCRRRNLQVHRFKYQVSCWCKLDDFTTVKTKLLNKQIKHNQYESTVIQYCQTKNNQQAEQ